MFLGPHHVFEIGDSANMHIEVARYFAKLLLHVAYLKTGQLILSNSMGGTGIVLLP